MSHLLVLLLAACSVDTSSPQAIPYDHVACGHCGMMVSDPRFAAQLWTSEGRWVAFDDPACALHYVADHGPSLAGVWFHDHGTDSEAWLRWDRVAFVAATGSPMDGGLAAVPAGTPDALSVGAASAHVLAGRAP